MMANYEDQWRVLAIDYCENEIAGWQKELSDADKTQARKGQLEYNISGMKSLIERLEK